MFGLGSGRPTTVSGNSLLGEWSLGRGCDLAVVVRLWARRTEPMMRST